MFYVTGDEDRVRCFSCGLELYNWKEEDVPYNEHIREQPQCDFIKDVTFQLDNGMKVGHFDFIMLQSICKNEHLMEYFIEKIIDL